MKYFPTFSNLESLYLWNRKGYVKWKETLSEELSLETIELLIFYPIFGLIKNLLTLVAPLAAIAKINQVSPILNKSYANWTLWEVVALLGFFNNIFSVYDPRIIRQKAIMHFISDQDLQDHEYASGNLKSTTKKKRINILLINAYMWERKCGVFFASYIVETMSSINLAKLLKNPLDIEVKETSKRTAKIVPTTSKQQLLKEIRTKYGASSKEYKEALSGMNVE